MPRRNLLLLLAIGVFAFLCFQKVRTNPLGEDLAESIDLIDRMALEKVPAKSLFEGAMQGMVERLDEYSTYIPPNELAEFEEMIDQQFIGVGMEVMINPRTRQMTVVRALAGSPAYQAGVRSGDVISRIGKLSTQGMSIKDAVFLLRGQPGESITLTILRPGEPKPLSIKLTRALVLIDTVRGDTRNSDGSWNFFLPGHQRIGYVRITSFAEKTGADLKHAVQWLVDRHARGLIIDLRDNPGGLLSAAREACDLFISAGTIATTRGREGEVLKKLRASGRAPFAKIPLVLLVNQDSASASEIVAGCLQDQHRALVCGQRTWGKGTVQQIFDLGNQRGALKLTTSSYWRPSNQNIHRSRGAGEDENWGVRPDPGCKVKLEGEELTRWRIWRSRRDVKNSGDNLEKNEAIDNFVDRQLTKALEKLEEH
ncbi:MAG: S41 family peptidase [Thermoguttaceae bacterium]